MDKKFTVSEQLPYPFEKVWEVIQKPSALNIHSCINRDIISDTEWIEHTGEGVDNRCSAQINETEHKVEIKSVNSKYSSESDDIILSVTGQDNDSCQVTIDYVISTGAVFNMVTFKLFGDKIMRFSSGSIFHHIEKVCKK